MVLCMDLQPTLGGKPGVDSAVEHGAMTLVVILQERKLLVPVADLGEADAAIALVMGTGLDWSAAAEGAYQDLGWPVDTPEAWAAYMRLTGGRNDEHRVVTLQVWSPSHTAREFVLQLHWTSSAMQKACLPPQRLFYASYGCREHTEGAWLFENYWVA